MKYSKETYQKALKALDALRKTLPEEQRPTLDFVAEAIREKAERDLMPAADAITELSGKVGQLERQFMEVFGDIEKIRMEHGVDNLEADNAFAELCGKYCDNNGVMCYKSGKGYQCENFKLKGVQNEKSEGA